MKRFKEFQSENKLYERDESVTGLDYCFGIISEKNLARLWSHTQDRDFAIVTAYRSNPDNDPEEQKRINVSNNAKLRQELNSKELGSYPLIGHWRECPLSDIPYDECPPEELVDVVERSYFVVRNPKMPADEFEKIILDFAEKYKQDGVILKLQSKDLFGVYSPKGKELVRFNKGIALNKVAQAFSQYVKKLDVPFVFEGIETPNGSAFVFSAYYNEGFRWLVS